MNEDVFINDIYNTSDNAFHLQKYEDGDSEVTLTGSSQIETENLFVTDKNEDDDFVVTRTDDDDFFLPDEDIWISDEISGL